ncbi:ATP-binding protein [Belliella kenyensis]|uniref:ATP-binding protein n=1 Tax=Belliella kenyensis TaxID=1472724 RepID=A0ABV8ELH0_9BACT|nr:ATP-binding protein [Belliella kenyensis]MCH7401338.1 ATP-binding protein [Belliella kenyensis]MDN3602781.1 ATP-binding protein [Belliella kenyensis]
MKKNVITYFSLMSLLSFWACSGGSKETVKEEDELDNIEELSPSLTLLWQTDDVLLTNESTLYDAETGKIYVSNIDGGPNEKDGKGFISIIDKEGNIIEKDWVTGIDAPKGMGISSGKLYVTNIDEIVEIDIEQAKIIKRHKVEGAKFLNDIDVHNDKIYFSDMETGKIHYLLNGELFDFAKDQKNINGLRVAPDGTLYGLDGQGLKKYDEEGEYEMVNEAVTGGDGLIIIDDHTFIASRWQGEIYLIRDGKETLILDTKREESNTADIDFIPEENILLVPTFFKNKVVAYKLSY